MTESKLCVEDRSIVVPGDVLATGMEYLPSQGTYRLGDNIQAERLGMLRVEGKVLKIIPLAGRYLPKPSDIIICKVIDVMMSGWRVDTNSAYSAVLPLKDATEEYIQKGADLTKYYSFGDYLVAQVTNVTSQKLVDISLAGQGLRKIVGGRIIEVNATKVPRIIGKQGSMVSMLKDPTGCKIIVGQNGIVWLDGDPKMEKIAIDAINLIEKKSHLAGLTEEVEKFLRERVQKGEQ